MFILLKELKRFFKKNLENLKIFINFIDMVAEVYKIIGNENEENQFTISNKRNNLIVINQGFKRSQYGSFSLYDEEINDKILEIKGEWNIFIKKYKNRNYFYVESNFIDLNNKEIKNYSFGNRTASDSFSYKEIILKIINNFYAKEIQTILSN